MKIVIKKPKFTLLKKVKKLITKAIDFIKEFPKRFRKDGNKDGQKDGNKDGQKDSNKDGQKDVSGDISGGGDSDTGLKSIITLVKKDLYLYLTTPLAYVILVLYLVVVAVIFLGVFKYSEVGRADLTELFTAVGFSFIIIIPALTMGAVAKEKQTGTMEYILTRPLSEIHFLVGKLLSLAILIILMLLLTLPVPLYLGGRVSIDVGQLMMQYVGSFILGMCFGVVGIAMSSLLKSEITAFISSLVISAFFMIIGSELITFTNIGAIGGGETSFLVNLDAILEKFSLLSHYQSISRGVLDLRDLLYFVAFFLSFTSLAYFLIVKDKFPKKHDFYRYSLGSLVVMTIIAILIGYLGQVIPGRIDFTINQTYTLSDQTVRTLEKGEDIINLTLYVSSNLPSEFQANVRTVEDLLRDYETSGQGNVIFTVKHPDKNEELQEEARNAGIQEIVFGVNTEESASRTVGFFGIAISYLDKQESITISNDMDDLEYQLTKKIKKLVSTEDFKVAIMNSGVMKDYNEDLSAFVAELSDLYQVEPIELTADNPSIGEDVDVLVVPGPNEKFDEKVSAAIKKFFENGGGVFYLVDPVEITLNEQGILPSANENSMRDLFADYGVSVRNAMAYDLVNNNSVSSGLFYTPYPLWIIAQAIDQENVSILKQVSDVGIFWGGPLIINDEKKESSNVEIYNLLKTSEEANVQDQQTGMYNINPNQDWDSKGNDDELKLAAAVEQKVGDGEEDGQAGRLVIVGDSDFISSNQLFNYIEQNQNLAFSIASIEWLIKDDSIAQIKAKTRIAPQVNLAESEQGIFVAASSVLPVIIVISAGLAVFYRRRKIMQKTYQGKE